MLKFLTIAQTKLQTLQRKMLHHTGCNTLRVHSDDRKYLPTW